MNPLVMLILALLTPFLMLAFLLVPPYSGIYGAAYIIYDHGQPIHPLAGKYLDVFYIIDVYTKLFHYWLDHMQTLSLVHYTLPVVMLPLACLIFALYISRKLVRKIKDIFHLSVSH